MSASNAYAETEGAAVLKKGERAPFDGILLTNADLALLEKELEALEEINAGLQKDLGNLRTFYSESMDRAYSVLNAHSAQTLEKLSELEVTPVIVDETAWWEPIVWVGTGAIIVGSIWLIDSAL